MARRIVTLLIACIGIGFAGCGGGSEGDEPDAAVNMPDAGRPVIEAPDDTWTWVSFPDSRCMDNSPTGIGVNFHSASDKVMIYLEGGGACFNAFTCSSVAHQDGFDGVNLADFATQYGNRGVFSRSDTDNPFADWNWVFVPYCTGDIHAGNAPSGFGGRVQVGYANMGFYLERLVPTFAQASHVVLTGSSAGGFGAAYNYDRVQQAFGSVPVELLDDSGPTMSENYLTPCLQDLVRAAWNLDATLPRDCPNCTTEAGGLINLATFVADKYPQRRFGLISSLGDSTIRMLLRLRLPELRSADDPHAPAAVHRRAERARRHDLSRPRQLARVLHRQQPARLVGQRPRREHRRERHQDHRLDPRADRRRQRVDRRSPLMLLLARVLHGSRSLEVEVISGSARTWRNRCGHRSRKCRSALRPPGSEASRFARRIGDP